MPLVLVISSYVAGSRVGGGIAPYVLGPMKVDPVHVPTCLFGRHPGCGPPGGAAVDADVMAKMLEGIEANGLFPLVDAVVTGHFSAPEQVAVASETIDRIKAAKPDQPYRGPFNPIVVVDPVMGDDGPGLYVKPTVAEALIRDLIPKAHMVAPNLWEFARLAGVDIAGLRSAEDVVRAAEKMPGNSWLISSVPSPAGIGVVHVGFGGARIAETPKLSGRMPNGTGDMLTLRYVGGVLLDEAGASEALGDAVGAVHAVLERAQEWQAPELPLAACSDLLAGRFSAPVRLLA